MTDFRRSDLSLQLIKALCVWNIPIHDMQLILSCFHMDGTGNGENNDNLSPLKVSYQSSQLPHSCPIPLFPNQVAPTRSHWWWLLLAAPPLLGPCLPSNVRKGLCRSVPRVQCHLYLQYSSRSELEGKTFHSVPSPCWAPTCQALSKGSFASLTCTLSQAPFVPCPPPHLYATAAAAQMFSIKAWAMPANFGTHESALSTGPPEITPLPDFCKYF